MLAGPRAVHRADRPGNAATIAWVAPTRANARRPGSAKTDVRPVSNGSLSRNEAREGDGERRTENGAILLGSRMQSFIRESLKNTGNQVKKNSPKPAGIL